MCENEGEGGGVLVTTTFSAVHTSATVEVQLKGERKAIHILMIYTLHFTDCLSLLGSVKKQPPTLLE